MEVATVGSRTAGRMSLPIATSCCQTDSGLPEQSRLTTGTYCSLSQVIV